MEERNGRGPIHAPTVLAAVLASAFVVGFLPAMVWLISL